MTAQITHLPADTSQEALLRCMAEDGAVIIDDALSGEQLGALDNDLTPFLKKEVYGRDAFTGFKTQRIGALIARSKACGQLALEPRMLDAARTYLAEHCDDVQLHFTSAVAIAPGESAQILHRDRGIWGGYVPRQIEPLFSTIWALTPFTRENGATQVVVGSHRWEKKRQPEPDEIAYAEMSPGSVLCYNGTVLHGGGANTTEDETRVGRFLTLHAELAASGRESVLVLPAAARRASFSGTARTHRLCQGRLCTGLLLRPGRRQRPT